MFILGLLRYVLGLIEIVLSFEKSIVFFKRDLKKKLILNCFICNILKKLYIKNIRNLIF